MEVVLAHTSTDFDSLAAQLAVAKLHPGARMVPGRSLSGPVREFLSLYRDSLPLVDLQYTDLDKISHVYIVDCQHADRLEDIGRSLIVERGCTYTVFDHHQLDPEGLGAKARSDSIIRPSGACASILVEKLIERKEKLTQLEATLLAIGIYEDSGCLTFDGTTPMDARCIAYLLDQGADLKQVSAFINPKLDDRQMELFQALTNNMELLTISGTKVVLATATHPQYLEGLATMTRRLMELASAEVAITAVYMRDRTHIVTRSDTRALDVRSIVKAFGGGGHPGAASAVDKHDAPDIIITRIKTLLHEHVRPESTAKDVMTSPVRTIKQDVTMEDAGRIMLRYGQDGLVVLEQNEIVGIVSRRDIDKALHHRLGHAPVRGFMSRPVISIGEDTTLSQIQATMVKEDIGRLPVIDVQGKLVGIVSRKEVLHTLYGQGAVPSDDSALDLLVETRIDLKHKLNALSESTRWLFAEVGAQAKAMGMKAYAVGGCVRDLFMDRTNFDIDIVVEGSAIKLAEQLQASYPGRFEVVAEHERFQTATIVFYAGNKQEVDISTARTEFYEYPAALPTVEASVLQQDLYRRDFTINALAICLNPDEYGALIDYFKGLQDIEKKSICILHPFSFIEDPTRIIRAARFASRLNFALDEKSKQQAQRAIAMGIFDDLGGFRLKEELKLILDSAQRLKALDLLNDLGGGLRYLAKSLVFDEKVRSAIRRAERLVARNPLPHSWIVYLGTMLAFLPTDGNHVELVLERLALANDERNWIRSGIALCNQPEASNGDGEIAPSDIYARLHGLSDHALAIAASVAAAGSPTRRRIKFYLDELKDVKVALSGSDLLKIGFPQGPEIKEALARVHQARLDGQIKTPAQELEFIRKHYPQYR